MLKLKRLVIQINNNNFTDFYDMNMQNNLIIINSDMEIATRTTRKI